MRFAGKCRSGKQWSYVTLADAMADLVRVQREMREHDSDPDRKVPERAHRCSMCKFWHLTSKGHDERSPRERNRIRKVWRRR